MGGARGPGRRFQRCGVPRVFRRCGEYRGARGPAPIGGRGGGCRWRRLAGSLSDRTFQQAVNDDWQRCYSLGVSAVPTYLSEGLAIVGAEPYDRLERLVTEAGAARLTDAVDA